MLELETRDKSLAFCPGENAKTNNKTDEDKDAVGIRREPKRNAVLCSFNLVHLLFAFCWPSVLDQRLTLFANVLVLVFNSPVQVLIRLSMWHFFLLLLFFFVLSLNWMEDQKSQDTFVFCDAG